MTARRCCFRPPSTAGWRARSACHHRAADGTASCRGADSIAQSDADTRPLLSRWSASDDKHADQALASSPTPVVRSRALRDVPGGPARHGQSSVSRRCRVQHHPRHGQPPSCTATCPLSAGRSRSKRPRPTQSLDTASLGSGRHGELSEQLTLTAMAASSQRHASQTMLIRGVGSAQQPHQGVSHHPPPPHHHEPAFQRSAPTAASHRLVPES